MAETEPSDAFDGSEPFDLSSTYVHLASGARAVPVPDFEWTPEYLDSYTERFAADGIEGRLVMVAESNGDWPSWERHPAGEEVVVCLSGTIDLIQRVESGERRITLAAGQAVVNPTGVWHTVDVREPGAVLFITPGLGTENEARS
jgi:quercetin dioxygenase-like cupin family protein